MTALDARGTGPADPVNDFKRKGCTCAHCKQGGSGEHRSGAPIVLHPSQRKWVTYKRPSSLGGPLEDKYHLDLWTKRSVMLGTAMSPAIAAEAMVIGDPKKAPNDTAAKKAKKDLDRLAEQALTVAKADEASRLGTQMHACIERLNLGAITIDEVPDIFRADADAYLTELERHGLRVLPGMVELKVVNDVVRAAGTFDLILDEYLSDLKTGASVDLAQVGIAVQLATYRNGLLYDTTTDERTALPTLDADVALVVHLPYGQATCTIMDVDIRAGWEAARLAAEAKSWNYRKNLMSPHVVDSRRVAAKLTATFPGATDVTDEPTTAAGWAAQARASAERNTDEGLPVREDAVRQAVEATCHSPYAAQICAWLVEGDDAGHSWDIADKATARRFKLHGVAVRLADYFDGDETDIAATLDAYGVGMGGTIGHRLGRLHHDQAAELLANIRKLVEA